MARVVVLGAGPAGVGAAWYAARTGHEVTVLERSNRVGGAAGSLTVGGLRVDHGSHRLHPATDPRILGELRVLLGDDLQHRQRRGRIRLADRWVAFPLRASDLVTSLPPGFALRAARDAALGWRRRPRADTFADVLRAGLGPTMTEHFYAPYARKLWGLPAEQLSGEQARRRVSANSPARLLRRLLGSGEGRGFYYPRGGFGTISERLAAAAQTHGAQLRLGAPVVALEPGADGVTVATEDGATVNADRVLSTLPITTLARLHRPGAPADVLSAADTLRYRAMLLIYLVLDVDRYTPYDAHYLPESDTPVTRISEPKNYRDGDDPPGVTVLCAELPCAPGDAYWNAEDAALATLVADALAACDLPAVRPREVVVRRLSHAYPIYERGYEPAFAALDTWADTLPRVVTLGRQGLFAHDNTHHALAMARDAVAALCPDGSWDTDVWRAARERFRSHVVED